MTGPVPSDPPPSLDSVVRNGCTLFGRRVRHLHFDFEDGGHLDLDLPVSSGGETAVRDELNATQKGILETLRASPKAMKRAAVARAMKRASCKGAFGLAFGELVAAGKVFRAGEFYADAPAKLPVES